MFKITLNGVHAVDICRISSRFAPPENGAKNALALSRAAVEPSALTDQLNEGLGKCLSIILDSATCFKPSSTEAHPSSYLSCRIKKRDSSR